MLELYHSGHTTCSKQVRHCLTEKALAYESRYVELWRYENLDPDYLKLNPFGVVPTLVHDGVPIVNSFCILEYVEDAFPARPLRPADPVLRAKSRLWGWLADEVHPAMADATYNAQMRKRAQAMDRATLDKVLAKMPVPERRERLATVADKGFSEAEIAASLRADRVLLRPARQGHRRRAVDLRRGVLARRHIRPRHRRPHQGAAAGDGRGRPRRCPMARAHVRARRGEEGLRARHRRGAAPASRRLRAAPGRLNPVPGGARHP